MARGFDTRARPKSCDLQSLVCKDSPKQRQVSRSGEIRWDASGNVSVRYRRQANQRERAAHAHAATGTDWGGGGGGVALPGAPELSKQFCYKCPNAPEI